jgi:hypothetical protein
MTAGRPVNAMPIGPGLRATAVPLVWDLLAFSWLRPLPLFAPFFSMLELRQMML